MIILILQFIKSLTIKTENFIRSKHGGSKKIASKTSSGIWRKSSSYLTVYKYCSSIIASVIILAIIIARLVVVVIVELLTIIIVAASQCCTIEPVSKLNPSF